MLITNFFAYYFDKCIVGSTQLNMEVNWPRDWQPRGLREWRGRLGEVLEAHTGLDRGLKDQGNQVTVLGSRPKEGARGRGFLSVLGEFLEHVVEPPAAKPGWERAPSLPSVSGRGQVPHLGFVSSVPAPSSGIPTVHTHCCPP